MISATIAHLALRGRLVATSVATTGSAILARTTTGYTRAAGSFVTDGFAVGQELLEAGFPTNGYQVIKSVAAGALDVEATLVASGAAGGRSLTVGLPEGRAFDNTLFTPIAGRPYIEEDFVPATYRVTTIPANNGYGEDEGLYIVKWFGLSGKGIAGIRRCADAVLARFAPGTALTLSDGTQLRVPVTNGPWAGQITPIDGGWSYVVISIPYIGVSINAVAA